MQWITSFKPRRYLGLTVATLISGVSGACGAGRPIANPLPAAVHQAAVAKDDPADPASAGSTYLPLAMGESWRYTSVGSEGRGETRTETIVRLLETGLRDGSGTMTVAEIERVDTGKKSLRFTLEVYPDGIVRSYDPTLPKLGAPILGPRSDKPQEWGYNPGHGATGYFGISQWPGTSSVVVGQQTFKDCVKVHLSTSGAGFKAFRRDIVWAPGVGPVRVAEGTDTNRQPRIYELADVYKP